MRAILLKIASKLYRENADRFILKKKILMNLCVGNCGINTRVTTLSVGQIQSA